MTKRRLLILSGLVAFLMLVIINLGYIAQFANLLHQLRWYFLILVVVAQGLSFYANAKYYQAFLAIFGYRLTTVQLYRVALAINFVNQAFPSSGVSGTSYLAQSLSPVVPVGKATLAQLVRYVFTFLSFVIVLGGGFLLLFLTGNLNRLAVRLMLLFLMLVLVTSVLLVTVVADRSRVEWWARRLIQGLNVLARRLRRRRQPLFSHNWTQRFFDEFYQGYHLLLQEKGHWTRPMTYALLGNMAEVATLYLVFAAFGRLVNPGIVIIGYGLANMISLAAFLSSGVGLYEATMVAAFGALGLPFALALSVTVSYRVLNFALFLPLGFHYYRQTLR